MSHSKLRLSNAAQIRFIINQFETNSKDVMLKKRQESVPSVIGPSVKDIARTFEEQNVELDLQSSNSECDHRSKLSIVLHCLGIGFVSLFTSVVPPVTIMNIGSLLICLSAFIIPRVLSDLIVYPFCRLIFGTLYPAYASYKAVRTKNVKEYVKWMMYWIVFALFTCAETFTDIFLNWFPFYYEVKIILVLWLLSPATKGSSILYRKFVHPALCRREQEIDEYIAKAKDQGYKTVLNLGTKGVNYGMNVIMQTAMKGGGGLVQQLRKSYSLSDLSVSDDQIDNKHEMDEVGDIVNVRDPRLLRRSISARNRSPRPSSVGSSVDMYFPEMDVGPPGRSVVTRDRVNLGHIRSSEDISSTYIPENNMQDSRNSGSKTKINKSSFTSIKRPTPAEESEFMIKELDEENIKMFLNGAQEDDKRSNAHEMLLQQMAMFMVKELKNESQNEKQELFSKFINILGNTSTSEPEKTSTPNVNAQESKQNETSQGSKNLTQTFDEIDNSQSQPKAEIQNEKHVENNETDNVSTTELTNDSLPLVLTEKLIENDVIQSVSIKSVESDDSDDELSTAEFNTPKGSPVLENKKRKNKKRQAPNPPLVTITPSSKETDNSNTVHGKIELQMSSEDDAPTIHRRDTSNMKKLQGKSTESITKLFHLSSKLTFWNKPSEHKKTIPSQINASSENISNKEESMDSPIVDKITSDNVNSKINSESDDEQFEDAAENNLENKDLPLILDDHTTYIPLKIETLIVNTSSKSTDV